MIGLPPLDQTLVINLSGCDMDSYLHFQIVVYLMSEELVFLRTKSELESNNRWYLRSNGGQSMALTTQEN
jgi:hypothetical protein